MAGRTMGFSTFLLIAGLVAIAPIQRPPPPDPAQPPAPAQERGRKQGRVDPGTPALAREEVPQSEGAPGDLPALARHLEFSVPSVDMDTIGRSRTDVASIAALADGFAVLVSDERDGARSFLWQPLDRELAPLFAPERIDETTAGKGQWDGVFALGPRTRLGAVWLDAGDRASALRGRSWDSRGVASAPAWSLSIPVPRAVEPDAAAGAAPVGPRPVMVWSETACFVASNSRGRVLLRELNPTNLTPVREDVIGRRQQPATSGPRLALDANGAIACAYDSPGNIVFYAELNPAERLYVDCGPGKLCGFAADISAPAAGWWLMLRKQNRLLLRHLERGGAPDRADVVLFEAAWGAAELAVGLRGPAALVQPNAGGLEVRWVGDATAAFAVTRTELCPADTGVIAARLAFNAGRCAFLWTERHNVLVDVVVQCCRFGGAELSPRRTLFEGSGSAVQDQPAAAVAAEVGAIAWTENRFGPSVIGVRGMTTKRKLGARELFLPAEVGDSAEQSATPDGGNRAAGRRPAIAMQPSGRGLVAWIGAGSSGPNIFAQAIEVDADGTLRASAPAVEVESDDSALPTAFAPTIVALRGERGFAVAWVRVAPKTGANPRVSEEDGRSELRISQLELDGRASSAPRSLAAGSRLAHPALAQLDDGRIVVVWDSQPRVQARRLAAWVLSERLEPELRQLSFETMWRDSDHSPAIAASAGGFALAWTSGEDPDCDVFARTYDCDGRPLSRPLALSPRSGGQRDPSLTRASDGSLVAVWQDDLSNSARFVGRRFSAKAQLLGQPARFAFGSEPPACDFATPLVLALGDGRLCVVGSHTVLGKGREIGLCLAGIGWDQVEGR